MQLSVGLLVRLVFVVHCLLLVCRWRQRPKTSQSSRGVDPYEPVLGGAGTDYPVRPSTSAGGAKTPRSKTPVRRPSNGASLPSLASTGHVGAEE